MDNFLMPYTKYNLVHFGKTEFSGQIYLQFTTFTLALGLSKLLVSQC